MKKKCTCGCELNFTTWDEVDKTDKDIISGSVWRSQVAGSSHEWLWGKGDGGEWHWIHISDVT